MSLTMSAARPTLPSISALTNHIASSNNSNERPALPPLSSLLNTTIVPASSTIASDIPVSPSHASINSSTRSITSFPTPASIKKTVRLPSFDSLKFEEKKVENSFNLPTPNNKTDTPIILPSIKLSPLLSTVKPKTQLIEQTSPLVEKRSYAFISHSPSTYPSQEPAIDNAQLARRKRRRTTPRELSILQEEFEKGSTPNKVRRTEIASRVDMTEKAVQIWFQNKRQTLRRQSNAEKEVHHIEPIYHQQHPSSSTGMTPIRPQAIAFTNQHLAVQPISSNIQQSSPIGSQIASSSSPSRLEAGSSPTKESSINTNQPLQNHLLVTPSRSPKVTKTLPMGGSSLTFRLTKNSMTTPLHSSTTSSSSSLAAQDVKRASSMTPIRQQQRQRQKPVMRVNPSPPKIHSSPLLTNKENVSPIKNKDISSPTKGLKVKREPLKELSVSNNNTIIPDLNASLVKEVTGDQQKECVSNLMTLKNWR